MVENEEVKTQVHVFSEHKEEDAEEFSHRYDNIRIEMEYPLSITVEKLAYRLLFKSSQNLLCGVCCKWRWYATVRTKVLLVRAWCCTCSTSYLSVVDKYEGTRSF